MSVCLTTLFGNFNDLPVEVWSPDYDKGNFWLIYEDGGIDDRIDLSREQLKELADAIDWLLA